MFAASEYYTTNHRSTQLPRYNVSKSRRGYDMFGTMDSSALIAIGIFTQEYIRACGNDGKKLTDEQCLYAPSLDDFTGIVTADSS